MYVFPPKLQKLSSWPSRSTISNAEDIWEISAPPDHSLYWSLVLSFIIASPKKSDLLTSLLGDKEEREELGCKKNIKDGKFNDESIRNQVMNFNPFKNQHSFYYNKDLRNIVRMFAVRLKRSANEMRKRPGDAKLNAATEMLKCCIQVYEMDAQGNKLEPTVYAPKAKRVVLVLFKRNGVCKKFKTTRPELDGDHKLIDVYGSGMSLNHVVPLRRDALGHILKRTDISHQIIQEIQHDFTGGGNFLVSLLDKDSRMETVPLIYASPYIAWKLAAAGFVTDPCALDANGLSAFYHCIGLDSTLLLHVLYDYASNSFKHSNKTTRNPDSEILRALIEIGRALKNDCSKSNGFSSLGCKKDVALKSCEEIICFIEFQSCLIKEIIEFQENSTQQSDEVTGSAVRRTHVIMQLLKLYPKYFYYPNANQAKDNIASESKYSKFQNYTQFSEYYENLDNYTCLLFFDNFLFLDLPADVMNLTVQNLFLTVFGYSLFPKCVHGVHCTAHLLTPEDCALRVIPFIFRSNFLESTKVVLQELKRSSPDGSEESYKSKSTKDHNPLSVLMQVTRGQKDLKEIKDEFSIGRLKKYVDVATRVLLSDADMKGVLSIERALQVIGETLNTSESHSVIGHLLCSCLPEDVVKEFFRIRNHILSHYRPRLIGGKFGLEKEILIFKNIQDMIKEVNSMFFPVYASQLFRIMDYMVERGLSESLDIDATVSLNMESERNGITRLLREKYTRNKGKYKCLTNNLFNYVEREAGDEKCHKFRKIGQISALKFLLGFVADKCDETNGNQIRLVLQDLDRLSESFECKANATKQIDIEISTAEIQEIIRIISDLGKITDCIFSEIKEEPGSRIDHSIVASFFEDARRFNWFTEDEMLTIKEKISDHLKLSREAKASLKDFLQKNIQLSQPEAEELLSAIFTSKKDKNCISTNLYDQPEIALKYLLSVQKDEQDVFQKKTDREDDLDCLMRFSEIEEGIQLLLKIDFPDDLHQKVLQFLNRKVEFLLDRISHLKSILIEEDEEILSLWNWGKSEAIKTHTRFLMGQRYRCEKDVRASLEMLLFDCMNILKTRTSLSRLWTKANDLFSGASLRDILSHGSTVLEIVDGCLDKDDLPSHLIDKMLELIEDGDALRTLSDLWEDERITNLKQFESVLEADDPSLLVLQKWMKKRPGSVGGWKDYLPLLPLK